MQNPFKAKIYSLVGRSKRAKMMFLCPKLYPYLDEIGWFRSKEARMPMDRNGDSLPWFTYPSIAFLTGRIRSDMSVFEYGSGNSTLWWSTKVSELVSCEHDLEWYNFFKERVPSNVSYIHRDLENGGGYCKAILQFDDNFDIVVIDGRDRVNCAKNLLPKLHDRGVIVWDNSDRQRYEDGYSFLLDNGFRRLDFTGLGPINNSEWCTSVFYRDDNCLNI